MFRKNQSGMVLVIVLMLLAVIAGIAVTLMSDDKNNIDRTDSLLTASQALEYLKGTQLWAAEILRADLYAPQNVKLRQFPISMPQSNIDIPRLKINASLLDAQGSFYNINNLSVAARAQGFQFWLNTQEESHHFVQEVVYWLSDHSNTDSLKEAYYANQVNPYRVSHQLFGRANEIKKVRYFTQNLNQFIMPYLIALPKATPMNINTVDAKDPKILMTLGRGLSWVDAESLISTRQRLQNGEFESAGAFMALPAVGNAGVVSDEITVQSQYFLLKTTIQLRQHVYHYETLFFRQGDSQKMVIKIIWQKQGN